MQKLKEIFGSSRLPSSVVKYYFCSSGDGGYRCLPTAGGFYDQRYRDYVEFSVIENKISEIRSRAK